MSTDLGELLGRLRKRDALVLAFDLTARALGLDPFSPDMLQRVRHTGREGWKRAALLASQFDDAEYHEPSGETVTAVVEVYERRIACAEKVRTSAHGNVKGLVPRRCTAWVDGIRCTNAVAPEKVSLCAGPHSFDTAEPRGRVIDLGVRFKPRRETVFELGETAPEEKP